MLQNLDNHRPSQFQTYYYNLFLNDDLLNPYQYGEHFINLISTLNQIYKEKKVFCKKFKEKIWTTRVYINTSNALAEILTDIIDEIFTDAGAYDIKSSVCFPPEGIENYEKTLYNCICIEAHFTTIGFKEIDYFEIERYIETFWEGYINLIVRMLKYSKDHIKIYISNNTMKYALGAINEYNLDSYKIHMIECKTGQYQIIF